MSEYQYYEFRAIDRRLTQREMAELRAISSRAEIAPTKFTNVYNYGDFHGDVNKLMEKYFDAFVYVANWGTHRFTLRVPKNLVEVKDLSIYEAEYCLSVTSTRSHVIVDFVSQEEGGYWEEGEGWLDSLLPVRDEVLRGDLRSAYLGWLGGILSGSVDEDVREPAVPAGMGKLSTSLKKLAEFLRIDSALIKSAAKRSAPAVHAEPSEKELAAWVDGLPEADKSQTLMRLLREDPPHLCAELLHRFHKSLAKTRPSIRKNGERRTAGEVLKAAGLLEKKSES